MLLSGLRIADVAIGHLTGGVEVYVEYTTPQTGRVSIGLLQDEENAPFYMDIRYKWHTWGDAVVLTNLVNNQWKTEERPGGFPFDSGYLTTVKIVPSAAEKAYKIYADGRHFFDFKYRSNGTPDKVHSLVIIVEDAYGEPTLVSTIHEIRVN